MSLLPRLPCLLKWLSLLIITLIVIMTTAMVIVMQSLLQFIIAAISYLTVWPIGLGIDLAGVQFIVG